MRIKFNTLLLSYLLVALASPAHSYWPTTVEENLPISTNPDIYEGYPAALPYPNGETLVVFWKEEITNCYQIIDRYGALVFPEPQPLTPTLIDNYAWNAKVIPDNSGGAFTAWYITDNGTYPGTYAQRLDSLCNRMWGDSGLMVTSDESSSLAISTDGTGGFLVTKTDNNGDIRAFRLDGEGNLLWGDGVIVCQYPYQQSYPKITHNGNGGAYVVWQDFRPPYSTYSAIFMQRLNASGVPMWDPNGEFIFESPWSYDVIPDGEGGFVLHCGYGLDNYAYRIDPYGNTLWVRDHVSWYTDAKIVEGEPGFFYLGFFYSGGLYAQRIDMQGHIYWPTWGSGRVGAVMINMDNWIHNGADFAYRYPYLYEVCGFEYPQAPYYPRTLQTQYLDSLGNQMLGNEGVLLTYVSTGQDMNYMSAVIDEDGGITAVYEHGWDHNVWAKRCDANGTLGGPDPRKRPEESYPRISGISAGRIYFEIPEAGRVQVDLYNLLGQHIGTIENAHMQAGKHNVTIDQTDLVSGIYFVRIKTPQGACAGKVAVVR